MWSRSRARLGLRRGRAVQTSALRGNGAPAEAALPAKRSSLRELALAAGPGEAVEVSWREGTTGELCSRFLALRVRPANVGLRNRDSREGSELPLRWALCECGPRGPRSRSSTGSPTCRPRLRSIRSQSPSGSSQIVGRGSVGNRQGTRLLRGMCLAVSVQGDVAPAVSGGFRIVTN